ncbi:MAG: hypothetical protein ABIC40_06030 [bacterium]
MNRQLKFAVIALGSAVILLGIATLLQNPSLFSVKSQAAEKIPFPTALSFTLTIKAPGQDPAVLQGLSSVGNMRLEGKIGGIATVNLLKDSKLFALTEAIKTAREIENPPLPKTDDPGWTEWLTEPGRVNPLNFAVQIGKDREFHGQVKLAGGKVTAIFDHGILSNISFPLPESDSNIEYAYGGIVKNPEIPEGYFDIPKDYMVMK